MHRRSLAVALLLIFGLARTAQAQLNIGQSFDATDAVQSSFNAGLHAALAQFNASNIISSKINLLERDDASTAATAATNAENFIVTDNVLALVGFQGFATSNASITWMNANSHSDIPFVGAFSGASASWAAFANVINIRSSFADDSAAIVKYCIDNQLTRVSFIFDSNFDDQKAAHASLVFALSGSGITLESFATTLNAAGVAEIYNNHIVDALVIVGDVAPVTAVIQAVRSDAAKASTRIILFSTVGAEQVASALTSAERANVFAASFLPAPSDTNFAIAGEYRTAIGANPTAAGFEGFVLGKFVGEVFVRAGANPTSASFLQTIYNSRYFFFGGITLGPFSDDAAAPCTQGARKVYINAIQTADGTLATVSGATFSWPGCSAQPSDVSGTATRLRWAQTCSETGEYSFACIRMRQGINVAFAESNADNRLGNVFLDLIGMDDQATNEVAYNNTIDFMENRGIFGFVGGFHKSINGTLAAMAALNRTLPIVGTLDGGQHLRYPFQRHIINTRPSYSDETAAMLNWMLEEFILHMTFVYEDDEFGRMAYQTIQPALTTALPVHLMPLNINKFPADGDVSACLNDVLRVGPNMVLIAASPHMAAKSVEYLRMTKNTSSIRWTTFSTSGEEFKAQLKNIPGLPMHNITMPLALPSVTYAATHPLVMRYKAAMARAGYSNYTQLSFEGYVNGLLIVEALARVDGAKTPEKFLDILYRDQVFVLGNLTLGPFRNDEAMQCNAGIRTLRLIDVNSTSHVIKSEFGYPGLCGAVARSVIRPIAFGQSAALTGPRARIGTNLRTGILAYFDRFNRNGGLSGAKLRLFTLDNYGNSTKAAADMKLMNGHQHFTAYLGWQIPDDYLAALQGAINESFGYFAPFGGSPLLRRPCIKNIVNLVAGWSDEVAAIVSWLFDESSIPFRNQRTFRHVSIFYENSHLGLDGYETFTRAMALKKLPVHSIGRYMDTQAPMTFTGDVETPLTNITSAKELPEAVIVVANANVTLKFLTAAKARADMRDVVFLCISASEADFLADYLGQDAQVPLTDAAGNPTLYVTSVLPILSSSSTHPLVKEYLQEVDYILNVEQRPVTPNYIHFEGYMMARWSARALQLIDGTINKYNLGNVMYEYPTYNILEYELGPFRLSNDTRENNLNVTSGGPCYCNQGSHQVWMMYLARNGTGAGRLLLNDASNFEFYFETCGVEFIVYILQEVSVGVRGFILALSVLAIIVVLVAMILLVIYRDSKTITASSPMFLGIILVGGLLLAVSPWFAIPWTEADNGNSAVCMTWVWLIGLGFTLFFAPLVIKTWRVYRIFNNRVLSRIIVIRDTELLGFLAIPFGLEVILLIIWTAVAHEQLLSVRIPGTIDQVTNICTVPNGGDQPFIITQSVFFALIAVLGCFFAFTTRNIKYGAFKESIEILFNVYNLTFLSAILVPLHAVLTLQPVAASIIRTIGPIFLVIISVAVLFGMKFYRILRNAEKMSASTTNRFGSTRSMTSGTTSTGKTTSSKGSSGSTTSTGSTNSSVTSSNESFSTDDDDEDEEIGKGKGKGKVTSPKSKAAPAKKTTATSPKPNATSPKPTKGDDEEESELTEESSAMELKAKRRHDKKKDKKDHDKKPAKKPAKKEESSGSDSESDSESSSEEEQKKKAAKKSAKKPAKKAPAKVEVVAVDGSSSD